MTSVHIPEKGMRLITVVTAAAGGCGGLQTGSASFKNEDGLGRAASPWAVGACGLPTPFPSQTKGGGTDRTTLGSGVLAIREAASSALGLVPAELHRSPRGVLVIDSEKLLGGSDCANCTPEGEEQGPGGRGIGTVQHDSASPASRTCVISRVGLEVWVGLEALPLPHTSQCIPRDKESTFRHLLGERALNC